MKLFKRKTKLIDVQKAILEEFQEMNENLSKIEQYLRITTWDSESKDDDIRRLKEKIKELRKQVKELTTND